MPYTTQCRLFAILITNSLISGHVFVYVVISRAPSLLLAPSTYCKCIPRERHAKWNDFTIRRHYGSSPWTYITSRSCLFDRDKHFVPCKIYIAQSLSTSTCSMKCENDFQTRSTRYTFNQFFHAATNKK